jgi:diguanylate cyclase (GGDEF)-like protein
MASRYGTLTLYSWTLALLAGAWLGLELAGGVDFPPWWAALLCVAACLLVFQFGVPAPRVGLISLERVPQIALLLAVGGPAAATICALASLTWPLFNRRYSQNSSRVALLRGMHNAGMTVLMLLTANFVYNATGGEFPLRALTSNAVVPLIAMAVVAQVVNISLMALFFKFDGRSVRKIVTPTYALADFIFVPAGVLAAVLFNSESHATFALFIALTLVFVLSFSRIGLNTAGADTELGPLWRIFQARRALHGARTIDELSERVVLEARSLFRFDEFQISLVNRERTALETRSFPQSGARQPLHSHELSTGLSGWAIERNENVLLSDMTKASATLRSRADDRERLAGSILIVPLVERDTAIGVLCIRHSNPGAYADADLHLLRRLAEEVAVAVADARAFEDADEYRMRLEQRVAERTVELEKANGEKERLITALRERSLALERESLEDPLTGVANRRHFMQRLAAEFEVAKVVGHPLTLAIADLDHFKVVNDSLGHRIGDEVLQQCAVLMSRLCRETDLLARIGGEEFAIVLPGTACDAAVRLCESVRHTIETHDWGTVHATLTLTVSIGLWQWDGNATVSELLHAADTQLYEAKRSGRNRVA